MKDSKAIHHLTEICETYGKQAAELKNLRRKVRELTQQRDIANARNAELRAKLALAQKATLERAAQPSAWGSAWNGGSRVHRMSDMEAA